MDYEVIKNEQSAYISIPVTLAEVEKLPVTLNSQFGGDPVEHAELLTDPNILCIRPGIAVTEGSWDRTNPAANITYGIGILVYDQVVGGAPGWHNAMYVKPDAAGYKMAVDRRSQESALWRLAYEKCPDLDNQLKILAAPYIDMVREYIASNPDEFCEENADI